MIIETPAVIAMGNASSCCAYRDKKVRTYVDKSVCVYFSKKKHRVHETRAITLITSGDSDGGGGATGVSRRSREMAARLPSGALLRSLHT